MEPFAMSQLLAYLYGLGAWNWFVVGVVLLGLEIVTPGVNLLWFGLAAVVVGAFSLVTGITWEWQLIFFALMAVGVFFIVRRMASPEDEELGDPTLNNRAGQYVGRVFVVEQAIANGRGRVRVGDTLWIAEGADAPVGARVRAVGTNGTVLMVERERG
jgi:membrane protein implicated in regulation of membrane protease activity